MSDFLDVIRTSFVTKPQRCIVEVQLKNWETDVSQFFNWETSFFCIQVLYTKGQFVCFHTIRNKIVTRNLVWKVQSEKKFQLHTTLYFSLSLSLLFPSPSLARLLPSLLSHPSTLRLPALWATSNHSSRLRQAEESSFPVWASSCEIGLLIRAEGI